MQNTTHKVILLGQADCGKTSILNRLVRQTFEENPQMTICSAFSSLVMESKGVPIHLGIWDTAGCEKYRAIVQLYYRDSHAAIICYDVTERNSYEDVLYWITQLQAQEKNCKIYICGTKIDLVTSGEKDREVSTQEAMLFANEIGGKSIVTSSKMDINIKNLFQIIADDLYLEPIAMERRKTIRISSCVEKDKNKCQC